MHTLAILPGDGIGPEVMTQALRVLDVIEKKFQLSFKRVSGDIGGAAYDAQGHHLPADTLRLCEQADAILLGSVGGPVDQQHLPKWHNCERNALLGLRQHFNFSINIRPAQLPSSLAHLCPLKAGPIGGGIDLVIFRELSGGLYFGQHEQKEINGIRTARDDCVIDENQIRHIANAAFKSAASRRGHLVSVDKANVLATSRLWRDVVNDLAPQYPDVTLEHALVDSLAMQLVTCPHRFDVLVTENLFGDILSDLAATLPGSLGLMPSASLNAAGFGLYEPAGGSAPDIAGKDIANPIAQIRCLALCLRHSFQAESAATAIEQAIEKVLNQDELTADLQQSAKDSVGCQAMTDRIIETLASVTITT